MNNDSGCTFQWNSRAIDAQAGETIDIALLRAGVRELACTRKRHRPLGVSGSFVQGVLAEVNGIPNCRLDRCVVEPGLRVNRQNAWPRPNIDLFKLLRVLPERNVRGGFEHTNLFPGGTRRFEIWERLLAFLAGGATLDPNTSGTVAEGQRKVVDALVIGAGPAGCAAANTLHASGRRVGLISRGPIPGLMATLAGVDVEPLHSGVETYPDHEAFGIYRNGTLVAAAPHTPDQPALAFETSEIILAIGRRSLPPLVRGNDLPGVMDAYTAMRLAAHVPTALGRIVVCGNGPHSVVAERLSTMGCNVIRHDELSALISIGGRTGVRNVTLGEEIACDTLVHAGPCVVDRNLYRQACAGGVLRVDADSHPSHVHLAGSAADGDDVIDLPADTRWATASVCPCMDVNATEIAELARSGMTHVEELKRQTSCGMGPCQGFPCWELMAQVLRIVTGNVITDRPTARPPRGGITVGQAAGLADLVEPLK